MSEQFPRSKSVPSFRQSNRRLSGSSGFAGDTSASSSASTAPALANKTIVSFVLDDPNGDDVIDAKTRRKEEEEDWKVEHQRAR